MNLRTMQILMDPDDRVVVYPVPANNEFVVSCGPLSLAFPTADAAQSWAYNVGAVVSHWVSFHGGDALASVPCESGKTDIPTWTPRPPGSSAA